MKDRQDMEGLWKSSRKYLLIVAFGVLLYEAMEHLSVVLRAVKSFLSVISPLFIGVAAAFIINLPMGFLENKVFRRWRGRAKRWVCLVLALVLVAAVIAGLVVIVAPRLVASVKTLAENFDEYTQGLMKWGTYIWNRLNFHEDVAQRLKDSAEGFLSQVDDMLSGMVTWALKTTMSAARVVFNVMLGTIISAHVLYRKETLMRQGRKLIKALFREAAAERIIQTASRTYVSLHNYLYGILTECFILGLLCFLGMSVLGIPYALLVSVIVGAAQLVPIVGAWASAITSTLLILVVDPNKALFFVIMLIAVQQIEGNLIYPRVVGSAVGISALWVLIAVLLGAGLFGFMGVLLCVPLTAVLYSITEEWVNRRLEARRSAGQDSK